jgi:hypothetical protein
VVRAGHALLVLVLLELALLDLGFVVLADGGHAAVQRFLLHLQHGDGDAGVQEVHGDAAAHGAGADHAHLLDGARRAPRGTSGILLAARSAKDVAQRRDSGVHISA